jgi:hypothetical protein
MDRDVPRPSGCRLSKGELLDRLDDRSRDHFGGPFSEGLLNDLIKDGLLPALQRSKNEGLKPVYEANASHYRRALQIKRLMWQGVLGRDALRIQLFLRGYGVMPWEIRDALRLEYGKHMRAAGATVRSTYLDNARDIGPHHKETLRKQMGEIDDRLKVAGLEMPTDFYIERARDGKRPDANLDDPLVGRLMIDPDSGRLSDQIEKSVNQPDKKFIEARAAFHWVDGHVIRRIMGIRIINDPRYSTILFLEMLCCVRSFSFKSILRIPRTFVLMFWHSVTHGRPKA